MGKPLRPELQFGSLDDVIADVDRLSRGPYERGGEWDLARNVDHVATVMGVPFQADMLRVPAIGRPIARFVIRRMLKKNRYPTMKLPMPSSLKPRDGISLDAARRALADAARMLRDHPDPMLDTPFGVIRTDEYRHLQRLHAAHHLAFLKST